MAKLTDTYLKKAPLSIAGTRKVWDAEIKGLAVFIGKRSKTWYFQKDVGGKTRRILIGRFPTISAKAARETAMALALDMSRGAGKQAQVGAPTLEAAMEAYLARPKLRSDDHKDGMRAQFRRHLGDWLKLPLDEISRAMAARRHAELAATPSTANHTLRYFRTVYNHARRTCDLPESPTSAIEWFEERPDGRVIEDLRAWRKRVESLANPIHRAFFELLLYTGLRKSEAFKLRWDDIHEDRIHLPVTKNGRSFDLPVTERHHAILRPLSGLRREWVFPSPKSLNGHLTNPERIEWSPHAHRRTFASVAVEAGVLEEIVGRLLNHTSPSVTGQRYVKPSLDALRPHMETICAELDRRISGGNEQS